MVQWLLTMVSLRPLRMGFSDPFQMAMKMACKYLLLGCPVGSEDQWLVNGL